MAAYYNEFDPHAAAWLRELIAAGHIAPGVVDERSIEDVRPEDLRGFTQCHFFAGIGVWSYALRRAGWADDRPVWTGSCPCQPFSAAGKGAAFADERHLWPAFFHLIEQCRPSVVFGEQVASKDADPWIDLVQDDLEALGYAVGAVPFPAAGVGAPNIRDRTYWVADASSTGPLPSAYAGVHRSEEGAGSRYGELERCGPTVWLADAGGDGCFEARGGIAASGRDGIVGNGATGRLGNTDLPRLEGLGGGYQAEGGRIGAAGSVAEAGESSGVGDAERKRLDAGGPDHGQYDRQQLGANGRLPEEQPAAGPTNGFWRDADWLLCRDGKWRPVEPGTFPLAHGVAGRVGLLRGYGNAINAEAAQAFIEIGIEWLEGVEQ